MVSSWSYNTMLSIFSFQLGPVDWFHFKPIKIDIHQGVIKIIDDEIFYDFQLNTTESAIVERDREEILAKKFRGFENPYHLIDAWSNRNDRTLFVILYSNI